MLARVWKNLELRYIADENVKCTATMENSLAVPQRVKYKITKWNRNSTPRYIPRRIKNRDLKSYLYAKVRPHTHPEPFQSFEWKLIWHLNKPVLKSLS